MKEYIERAEAINAIRQYQYPYGVEFLLANIPAADVAPVRHGRWKNGGNGLYDTCSACDKEIYLAIPMNYCPNCGALMREVGNGEK